MLTDITARAPNGYYKGPPEPKNSNKTKSQTKAREWHVGPPRVGTFSMRATRFRLRAGLLSWEKKDGTVSKNQRLLDIIPAQYKHPSVNSIKEWRDLNKKEIKKMKDGALRKPQQARKAKRAAQAEKDRGQSDTAVKGAHEVIEILSDGDEIQYDDEDTNIAPNDTENVEWPDYDPNDFNDPIPVPQTYHMDAKSNNTLLSSSSKVVNPMNNTYEQPQQGFIVPDKVSQPYRANTKSKNFLQLPSAVTENQVNIMHEQPQPHSLQPRKRSRDALNEDSETIINERAQKRARVPFDAQYQGNGGGLPRSRTSSLRIPQQSTSTPYIAGGVSPASPHLSIGSNDLGQGHQPMLSGHQSYSSSPMSHSDRSQSYSTANTELMMSNILDSNTQAGHPNLSFNALYAQNENFNISQPYAPYEYPTYGYVQPDLFPQSQMDSHSFGHSGLSSGNHSRFNGHNHASGRQYAPESEPNINMPTTYSSHPQSIPSVSQNPTQNYYYSSPSPSTNTEWATEHQQYLLPSSSLTNGKRKRSNTSNDITDEQLNGQPLMKRARGPALNQAVTQWVQNPSDAAAGAVNDYLTPTTGFNTPTPIPTSMYKQEQANPNFNPPFQPGYNIPSYTTSSSLQNNTFPPVQQEDAWNGYGSSSSLATAAAQPAMDNSYMPTDYTSALLSPSDAWNGNGNTNEIENENGNGDEYNSSSYSYQAQPAIGMPDNWNCIYPTPEDTV